MTPSLTRSRDEIPELIEPCTAAEIVGHPTRTLLLRYLRQHPDDPVSAAEFAETAEGARLPFARIAHNLKYLAEAGVMVNAGKAEPKRGQGRKRTVYKLVPGPLVDWIWKLLDVIDAGAPPPNP